jgi:hypothetical protein
MWGLGSQGIELFGGREAFCSVLDQQLPFLEHVHELDADQRALGCLNDLKLSMGRVTRLTPRWSCSTRLFRCFTWRMMIAVPCASLYPKGQSIRNWLFSKGSEAEREKVW